MYTTGSAWQNNRQNARKAILFLCDLIAGAHSRLQAIRTGFGRPQSATTWAAAARTAAARTASRLLGSAQAAAARAASRLLGGAQAAATWAAVLLPDETSSKKIDPSA